MASVDDLAETLIWSGIMGRRQADVIPIAAPDHRRPGSVRQARQREREARGAICLTVEIVEADVAGAAIASGVLSEEQALDRRELGHVVEDLVRRWCREWGPHK
jgi:hypothetical protein